MVGRERAPRRAIWRARPVESRGELVEIGLADRNGARVDETLDHGRGFARVVGKRRARGSRHAARKIDVVLDSERYAVKRFASGAVSFEAMRNRHKLVAGALVNPDVVVAARID